MTLLVYSVLCRACKRPWVTTVVALRPWCPFCGCEEVTVVRQIPSE